MSVVIAYNAGMTKSVNSVAKVSPKMMVLANGIQIGDFPPNPTAIGINPQTVVMVVNRIGRNRTPAPLRIARHRPLPFLR